MFVSHVDIRRSRRSALRNVGIVLAATLAFFATAQAADPRPPDPEPGRPVEFRAAPRLVVAPGPARPTLTARERGRLLTRVAVPMESLSAYPVSSSPEFDAFQPVLFDEMSDEVYRGVRRATGRALRNYLLEVTDLERKIAVWIDSRRGGRDGALESDNTGRVRFDVGLHRFIPEAQMRYEMPHGSLKFVLGAQGAIGVRYRLPNRRDAAVRDLGRLRRRRRLPARSQVRLLEREFLVRRFVGVPDVDHDQPHAGVVPAPDREIASAS